MLRVPRPTLVSHGKVPSMEMIAISGWKLTLKVLHPSAVIDFGLSVGVKVIYGNLASTPTPLD